MAKISVVSSRYIGGDISPIKLLDKQKNGSLKI